MIVFIFKLTVRQREVCFRVFVVQVVKTCLSIVIAPLVAPHYLTANQAHPRVFNEGTSTSQQARRGVYRATIIILSAAARAAVMARPVNAGARRVRIARLPRAYY